MRKSTKIWLVVAAVLVVAGIIMFAAVMGELRWNFRKLSTNQYETNTYTVTKEFSGLSIHTDTADIRLALSHDGSCRVECYEDAKAKHSVAVEEDTLVIALTDNRAWYDYIGFHFSAPKITVYLPQGEYAALDLRGSTGKVELPGDFRFASVDISLSTGDVACLASASGPIKIKTSTGRISLEDVSAGALELSASTGKITVSNAACQGDVNVMVTTGKSTLSNVTCKNLTATGDTGDISLEQVIVEEKLSVQRTTGDVLFDRSDAGEIFVTTDTGDVRGSLLTAKVFITHTDTGRVDVPKTVTGGRCEITTDTGDIKLEIS